MNTLDVTHAVFAGACFHAGMQHMMTGMRSEPPSRTHLSFAVVSLFWGIYSINLIFLDAALASGIIERFIATDKWGVAANYLSYASLCMFIHCHTRTRMAVMVSIAAGIYGMIALSNFVLPFTWVYTVIKFGGSGDPDACALVPG